MWKTARAVISHSGRFLHRVTTRLLRAWASQKPVDECAGVHQGLGIGRIHVAVACVVPRGDGVPVPRQVTPEEVGDAGEASRSRCCNLVRWVHCWSVLPCIKGRPPSWKAPSLNP